ncbi:MAG: hypothetical protein KDG57_23410 [Rhodoferax sp.]|nr:hypothetical protein [Rhodoferax sp.]
MAAPTKRQLAARHVRRLRPIRDPGDDAVDEMLQPLPSPVDEEATHAA